MKHRETENLKYKDFLEMHENKKNQVIKEKFDIVEKHIELSII